MAGDRITRLAETEAPFVAVLREHLPYELDMLEGSFVRLHAAEFKEQRNDVVTRNALIEAFWTHARNLVEFLTHPKGDGLSGAVSARDLAVDFFPDMKMKSIDQQINAQISHLTYDRKTLPHEKLNQHQMLRVKQAIDREIRQFETRLMPEYRARWNSRQPSEWIETAPILGATDELTSTSTLVSNVFGTEK